MKEFIEPKTGIKLKAHPYECLSCTYFITITAKELNALVESNVLNEVEQ